MSQVHVCHTLSLPPVPEVRVVPDLLLKKLQKQLWVELQGRELALSAMICLPCPLSNMATVHTAVSNFEQQEDCTIFSR